MAVQTAASDTGIVFYSRTGHSRRLAQRLAGELDGTLVELTAPDYKPGVLSYLRAGFDSVRQRDTRLSQPLPSLAEFDRVVLCGPVWTSYPAVPLRTLMRRGVQMPDTVALFLTRGGRAPARKAFAAAQADMGHALAAAASLSNYVENTEEEERLIADFLADLETAKAHAG